MYGSQNSHSIYAEMRDVHTRMIRKYRLNQEVANDVARAKTMENYLRAFKQAGNFKQKSSSLQASLEKQMMQDIAAEVGRRLNIDRYSLFRNKHFWYSDSSQQRWGADDVFEAELQRFLNVAIERASDGAIKGDAALIGNLPANISKELMQELSIHGQDLVDASFMPSEIITGPKFRSGKVDVTSFTASVTADIQPMWHEFINAFSGAKFTVKNYASDTKTEIIHLGNTDIKKSLLSTLGELVNTQKEAVHIYYHSLYYADNLHDALIGRHILHLRFAYELAGNGLRDAENNRLDAADFFIYNDPVSDNIYVRSTKAMIADAMNYLGDVRDPIRSNIIVLKNSF